MVFKNYFNFLQGLKKRKRPKSKRILELANKKQSMTEEQHSHVKNKANGLLQWSEKNKDTSEVQSTMSSIAEMGDRLKITNGDIPELHTKETSLCLYKNLHALNEDIKKMIEDMYKDQVGAKRKHLPHIGNSKPKKLRESARKDNVNFIEDTKTPQRESSSEDEEEYQLLAENNWMKRYGYDVNSIFKRDKLKISDGDIQEMHDISKEMILRWAKNPGAPNEDIDKKRVELQTVPSPISVNVQKSTGKYKANFTEAILPPHQKSRADDKQKDQVQGKNILKFCCLAFIWVLFLGIIFTDMEYDDKDVHLEGECLAHTIKMAVCSEKNRDFSKEEMEKTKGDIRSVLNSSPSKVTELSGLVYRSISKAQQRTGSGEEIDRRIFEEWVEIEKSLNALMDTIDGILSELEHI